MKSSLCDESSKVNDVFMFMAELTEGSFQAEVLERFTTVRFILFEWMVAGLFNKVSVNLAADSVIPVDK